MMKKFTKKREVSGAVMIKMFDENNKEEMDQVKNNGWKPVGANPVVKKKSKGGK